MFQKKHQEQDAIFIAGNGVVGHRVADRLLKAGYGPIRVGVPDPTSGTSTIDDLKKHGAEMVKFVFEDESTYEAALDGAKIVFFNIDPLLHVGLTERFTKFFTLCKTKRIHHIVKVSFFHALTATRARHMMNFHISMPSENPFQHVPMMVEHGNCDELIMKGGNFIPYTILFTTHKMSDPLTLQTHNLKKGNDTARLCGASQGHGVNYVSPNDIAAAAVRVLTNPTAHQRVGYSLTGPHTIPDHHVAAMLGQALQRRVSYVELDPEDFVKEERKVEHDPVWLLDELVHLEQLKATGIEETDFHSNDFEKLCGRPAETFETYLSSKNDMTPTELAAF